MRVIYEGTATIRTDTHDRTAGRPHIDVPVAMWVRPISTALPTFRLDMSLNNQGLRPLRST
jgi:hypothetical protein